MEELDKKLHTVMSAIWKAYRAESLTDDVAKIKAEYIADPDAKYIIPFIEFMASGLVPAINHKRGMI